jgi:hypothetical protein
VNIVKINQPYSSPDSFVLIRFGKKECLEQIKNGKLVFKTPGYYREYEKDEIIGDRLEGVSSILFPDDNTQLIYSHPAINSGVEIDVTKSIKSIHDFPEDDDIYICCFSYVTIYDILNKKNFDERILNTESWGYVMFFLDPIKFIKNLKTKYPEFCPEIRKVTYHDYDINHDNLNVFSKSSEYEFEKEIRIKLNITLNTSNDLKYLNTKKSKLEIDLMPIEGIIIPTKDFINSFIVEKTVHDETAE